MANETPWKTRVPGSKGLATIPLIDDANDYVVAHVLGGKDAAETIVTAVNSHAALVAALRAMVDKFGGFYPDPDLVSALMLLDKIDVAKGEK